MHSRGAIPLPHAGPGTVIISLILVNVPRLALRLSRAARLRKYEIRPKVIRIGDTTPRGYERPDLRDAWKRFERYMPQPPQEAQQAHQNREHQGLSTNSNVEPGKSGRSTGSAQPYHLQDAGEQLTS
jgi:hypothetical protein